jgi:hypothetical protein
VEDIHDRKQAEDSIRVSWEYSIGEQNMAAESLRIAEELRNSIATGDIGE